jgi:hypothetical protein
MNIIDGHHKSNSIFVMVPTCYDARTLRKNHLRQDALMRALLSRPTTAFYVTATVMASNVLLASGFAVTGLVQPQAILPQDYAPNSASLVFALYAAARTLPLAVCAFWAIWRRSASGVIILGTLAGFIQVADAIVGFLLHDPSKTIGPLVVGIAQLLSVGWLARCRDA